MRLDKFISYALNITRNQARDNIKQGLIKVNNNTTHKTDFYIDELVDEIMYHDEVLEYRNFIYLMLNKPAGVVSATVDRIHKTALELISGYEKYNLSIAGRLDKDVEGLLILSNDGKFLHNLTSPKKDISKVYYVIVDGEFAIDDVVKFQDGFDLFDGSDRPYHTKEAILEIINKNEAYITISEGKFHQVKNMCLAVGKEVKYLKRIKIGTLELDSKLNLGEYRDLSVQEVMDLKKQFT